MVYLMCYILYIMYFVLRIMSYVLYSIYHSNDAREDTSLRYAGARQSTAHCTLIDHGTKRHTPNSPNKNPVTLFQPPLNSYFDILQIRSNLPSSIPN